MGRHLVAIRFLVPAVSALFVLVGARQLRAETRALAPDSERARSYRRASSLLESAPREAFRIISGVDSLEPIDDFRLELLQESAQRAGEVQSAVDALDALEEATSRRSVELESRVTRGELALLRGRVAEAASIAGELGDTIGDLDLRSAVERYLRSRLLRLRHDVAAVRDERERARELARELLIRYPGTEATGWPHLTEVEPLEASDRYDRAVNLYDAWDYEKAREEFRALVDHDLYDDNARWYLGRIALDKLRDSAERAERRFDAIVGTPSPFAEKALYYRARAEMTQEKYDEALETFDLYSKRYPYGRYTESVYYYRGWLPYDHDENERALEGFEDYIDRYGRRGARSSYVYGFYAWTYMRMEKWQKAIEAYDRMEPFGNMLEWGKALYWQAYAHRQLDETDRALEKLGELRDTYPLTYYGMLGEQLRARIEGSDPRASEVWWPDGGGVADDAPRLDVRQKTPPGVDEANRPQWRRLESLVAVGERERARETFDAMYDTLLEGTEGERRDRWMHALGRFVGDYQRMWRRATGGSISAMPTLPEPDSLDAVMAYPRAYPEVVQSVADEFEIPPYLMWSIMRQESRYSPAQISHADAVGALQMIPRTARKVAADLGTEYNPRTFYKPEVGFRFSGFYMKKLLKLFDGKLVPMAAAYNSGPKAVARWFEENPDASFPWLIEEFAYNEGRAYCRKVAEHFLRYLYVYEDDPERRGKLLDALFPLDRDVDLPDDVGY